MSGTQKALVAIVAIIAVAAVGIVWIRTQPMEASSQPAAPLPPTESAAITPGPSPVATKTADKPEKVSAPRQVHAKSLGGRDVRIDWTAEARGVAQFQILDGGKRIQSTPPTNRHVDLTASYGAHCFRVVALARPGYQDSSASACGSITITKPRPPPASTSIDCLGPGMPNKQACPVRPPCPDDAFKSNGYCLYVE